MRCREELTAEFAETGIIRLDHAFSPGQAQAMQAAIWGYLNRHHQVFLDEPSSWPAENQYSFKNLRRNPALVPLVDNPAVTTALDWLFGPTGWQRPKPGAQILLSFPSPAPWVLPSGGWHMDGGFELLTWPVPAVKLFAFVDEVDPQGGGTLLLSGSHRLVERYSAGLAPATGGNSVTWGRFMKQDPWLREVYRGGSPSTPGRDHLDVTHDIGGVPVKVVELTGQPGDVVITHLHVFHCVTPNVARRPRQMLGKGVARRDKAST